MSGRRRAGFSAWLNGPRSWSCGFVDNTGLMVWRQDDLPSIEAALAVIDLLRTVRVGPRGPVPLTNKGSKP